MIQVQCHCGNRMQVGDEYAGGEMHCPECRARVQIPRHSPQSQYVEPIGSLPAAPPPAAPAPEHVSRRPPAGNFDQPPPIKSKPNVGLIVAIAGGAVFLVVAVIVLLVFLVNADSEDEAGRRYVSRTTEVMSSNNMRQLGIAMHSYHDVHKSLPPAAVFDKDGKPLLSWRVLILPYVEQANMYKQFRMHEPWDSPHNKQFLHHMPEVFKIPEIKTAPTKTHYQVLIGPNTLFGPMQKQNMRVFGFAGRANLFGSKMARLSGIRDGASNTAMIVEATKAVPWTAPQDLIFDEKKPLAGIGAYRNGFHIGTADGAVRLHSYEKVSERTMRLVANPTDGMAIGPDF